MHDVLRQTLLPEYKRLEELSVPDQCHRVTLIGANAKLAVHLRKAETLLVIQAHNSRQTLQIRFLETAMIERELAKRAASQNLLNGNITVWAHVQPELVGLVP